MEEDGSVRWYLDHLFVDQDAVPTLVEVKRATDTRIRREVVAQIIATVFSKQLEDGDVSDLYFEERFGLPVDADGSGGYVSSLYLAHPDHYWQL